MIKQIFTMIGISWVELVLLWLAIGHGIVGAGNLFMALTWVVLVLMCVGNKNAIIDKLAQQSRRSIPIITEIRYVLQIVVWCILIWHGWWVTGGVYFINTLMGMMIVAKVDTKRNEL